MREKLHALAVVAVFYGGIFLLSLAMYATGVGR